MPINFAMRLSALGVAALGLAACVDETTVSVAPPNSAEQACLAAVSNTANNGDVTLLGSQFSEAGTEVQVGVGPDRAPWKCIAYKDGTTAGVQYMGGEG